eukprot:COSAG02_NODE_1361_length_13053_cov_26.443956_3_plen_60_part_00
MQQSLHDHVPAPGTHCKLLRLSLTLFVGASDTPGVGPRQLRSTPRTRGDGGRGISGTHS